MTAGDVAVRQEQGGMERRRRLRKKYRESERGGGGERDRDLQTNLITSLQNGMTLLALELLKSVKERKEEGVRY